MGLVGEASHATSLPQKSQKQLPPPPPTGSHCLQVIRYKAFLRDLQAVFREQSPTPYSNRRRKPGPETVSERSHLCGQAE